jgi:hypothetical protein
MAVDLFPSLTKLGKRDFNWYSALSEEDKKTVHPFVLARWLVGTSDEAQLVRYNEFVNPYLFPLGAEKELLFKLCAAASTGRNTRYQWIKQPSGKKAPKIKVEVIEQFYDISTREALLYIPIIQDVDLLEMAEQLGWENDQLKKLKADCNGPGDTKTSGRRKKGI